MAEDVTSCSILGTCSAPTSLHFIDVLESEVRAFYDEQKSVPPKVIGRAASILSMNHPKLIADAIQKHFGSRVDIYVNDAAATDRTPVGGVEIGSFSNVLLANLQVPAMIIDLTVERKYFQQNCRIIFTSSVKSTRYDHSALMNGTTEAADDAMARIYANASGDNMPELELMAGTLLISFSWN
ncbi:Hypothetical predicted protein [Lecanosticta acicola]|uniref:Uncharacterized protein n=1 Tax=Lecanosticta acicola TaxID=111012 RepID=A0AAI8Z0X0_9PEZI|nr:Hypothetical predicted protein [Lecanosticta acicola]